MVRSNVETMWKPVFLKGNKIYSQRDKQLAKEEVLLYNKKNGSDVENSQSTSRKRKTIRRI